MKKYVSSIILLVLQNFLFIIYPTQLWDFLDGYNRPQRRSNYLEIIYLRDWLKLSSTQIRILTIIATIVLTITTLILIYLIKLSLEEKFGYFSIVYIFIGMFSYIFLLALILFSLIILLFVPFLNEKYNGIEFLKSNKILIIGLFSIMAIFFAWSRFIFFNFIPNLNELPLVIFYNLRWIFLLSIMLSSLIYLKIQKSNLFRRISLK